MIRAEDHLRDVPSATISAFAKTWTTAASPMAIASAMRSEKAKDTVFRTATTPVMREDIFLLCANPHDAVADDEVVDPEALTKCGFLVRVDDELFVNADVALTLIATTPVEYGFAATLVARLSEADRMAVGRGVQIGPRPSPIDAILDISASLTDEAAIMRRVARLPDSHRAVLREALSLGELPDETDGFPLDAAPPTVVPEPGPAGEAGLVFRVAHEEAGLAPRPVIPLELMEVLPRLLSQVPPPPEPVAAKPRRRGTSRRSSVKKRAADSSAPVALESSAATSSANRMGPDVVTRRAHESATGAAASGSGIASMDPMTQSGNISVLRESLRPGKSMTASGAMTPYRLGRVRSIQPAAAIVDLETAKVAEAAQKDPRLSEDILDVISESLVVLRAGVNAREWAEQCALRLGL